MIKLFLRNTKETDKNMSLIFFLYIKMANNYYQKNKEKLQNEARKRYQYFSEEEKNKKCQYACKQYRNLSEKKKKKRQYGCERYKNLLENK